MLDRYTRPEMGRLWSEEARLARWLEVELALVDVLAERGEVPSEAARTLRAKARVDVTRMRAIEAEVKHDVIAFVSSLAEQVGDAGRFLHLGLTSSDVVDTAFALQLRDAADLLLVGVERLRAAVRTQALRHRRTPMIGRTHGIHAEPITFGLKLANWYAETQRNIARMKSAAEQMRVGKLSGAVGTFAHLDPAMEEKICAHLGLEAAAISSQVIQRDRHAYYITTLAVIASTLDKIATEIRHLQRTEVREAEEFFSEKQKGSSAMPHKRNPITTEQISGLARVVRGNAQAALENVALWHERDISHSSVERVILPDSTILLDYLLNKTTNLIDKMFVYPERMKKNLESTGGLIFSGQLLLDLAESGMSREDAYQVVQKHAMRAWQQGLNFRELVQKDKHITSRLSSKKLAHAFNLSRQLRNVDNIFERVFGRKKAKKS